MDYDTGFMGSPIMPEKILDAEIDSPLIYAVTYYGKLYSVDFLTGTKNWYYRGGNSSVTTLAISPVDGTLYHGTKYNAVNNGIYAVDPLGADKWFYSTTNNLLSSPVMSGEGKLYQYVCDGYVHAFSVEGAFEWKVKISNGAYLSGTIAVTGGTGIIATLYES